MKEKILSQDVDMILFHIKSAKDFLKLPHKTGPTLRQIWKKYSKAYNLYVKSLPEIDSHPRHETIVKEINSLMDEVKKLGMFRENPSHKIQNVPDSLCNKCHQNWDDECRAFQLPRSKAEREFKLEGEPLCLKSYESKVLKKRLKTRGNKMIGRYERLGKYGRRRNPIDYSGAWDAMVDQRPQVLRKIFREEYRMRSSDITEIFRYYYRDLDSDTKRTARRIIDDVRGGRRENPSYKIWMELSYTQKAEIIRQALDNLRVSLLMYRKIEDLAFTDWESLPNDIKSEVSKIILQKIKKNPCYESRRNEDMLQLANKALESCKFRGHRMGNFHKTGEHTAYAKCERCGMEVDINTKPLPNEIDISGEAVALSCRRKVSRRNPESIVLEVSYDPKLFVAAPLALDKKLEKIVGKHSSGGGMGFGGRDINWYDLDLKEAIDLKQKIEKSFPKFIETGQMKVRIDRDVENPNYPSRHNSKRCENASTTGSNIGIPQCFNNIAKFKVVVKYDGEEDTLYLCQDCMETLRKDARKHGYSVSKNKLSETNPGPRGGVTEVQSFLFDRDLFTVKKAKKWLKDHGHKYGTMTKSGERANYYQFPQFSSEEKWIRGFRVVDKFKKGRTYIHFPEGIKVRVAIEKGAPRLKRR